MRFPINGKAIKQRLTETFRRFARDLTSGEAAAADRRLELIADYSVEFSSL